jgi:hypothetical protein
MITTLEGLERRINPWFICYFIVDLGTLGGGSGAAYAINRWPGTY